MTTTLSLCELPLELHQAIWAYLSNLDVVTVMCVSQQLRHSVSKYDLQRRKWLASTVDALAFEGDLEGLKYVWAHARVHATWAMVNACRFGHLAVAVFLCERMRYNIYEFNTACAYGHLDIVKFLHGCRDTHKMMSRVYEIDADGKDKYDYEGYEGEDMDDTNAMDGACQNGQLSVVKFLLEVGMPYTKYAMDFAAGEGHLDVVRHIHGLGATCTTNAIDHACRMGHLPVVQYLLDIGKPYTVWAMDYACMYGQVHILEYFHRLGKLKIMYGADAAYRENQVSVLKFLHETGYISNISPRLFLEMQNVETEQYLLSISLF